MNRDKLRKLLSGGPTVEVAVSHGGHDVDPGLDAADAILKAIRADSAEQLDMALRDHYEACESEHGDGGGDEGDGGYDERGEGE